MQLIHTHTHTHTTFFLSRTRCISIFSCFSKVSEKFLLEKLKSFVNGFLLNFIAEYWKNYSRNHVLIRFIERWKGALNKDFLIETMIMDLSKILGYIPNNLLTTRLHAIGFSEKVSPLLIHI